VAEWHIRPIDGQTIKTAPNGARRDTMSHKTSPNPLSGLAEILESFSRSTIMIGSFSGMMLLSVITSILILGSPAIGVAIGFFLIASIAGYFLVSVPEITGLITVNIATGELHVYETGLHIRYPWEQVEEGNYINLRQVTEMVEENYPAQDSLMDVKWLFQYTPMAEGLPRYISADDNTIKRGLKGIGGSVLGHEISAKNGEECKKKQEEIEVSMMKKFGETKPTPLVLYGIRIDRVAIVDMDYDKNVQKARSALATTQLTIKMADAIQSDDKSISRKDAMNFALVITDKAKKNIFEVEGLGPMTQAILKKFGGG